MVFLLHATFPNQVLAIANFPKAININQPININQQLPTNQHQPTPTQLLLTQPSLQGRHTSQSRHLFSTETWLLLLRFSMGPWIQERAKGSCRATQESLGSVGKSAGIPGWIPLIREISGGPSINLRDRTVTEPSNEPSKT